MRRYEELAAAPRRRKPKDSDRDRSREARREAIIEIENTFWSQKEFARKDRVRRILDSLSYHGYSQKVSAAPSTIAKMAGVPIRFVEEVIAEDVKSRVYRQGDPRRGEEAHALYRVVRHKRRFENARVVQLDIRAGVVSVLLPILYRRDEVILSAAELLQRLLPQRKQRKVDRSRPSDAKA
jgi:hypothetical protein